MVAAPCFTLRHLLNRRDGAPQCVPHRRQKGWVTLCLVIGSVGRKTPKVSTPNPGMYAEPVLWPSEERKALKSFRCSNSMADGARSG